jgi:hypothetical protein
VIWKISVKSVNVASRGVVVSPLPCVCFLVIDRFESYSLCKLGQFMVLWVGGDVIPLDDRPLRRMSRLKSPPIKMWCVE